MKACVPSPYIGVMYTPKRSIKEYALSSIRFVFLRVAQDIFLAILTLIADLIFRTATSTLVIFSMASDIRSSVLDPIKDHEPSKNRTSFGAISSWSVHPRVNQMLLENENVNKASLTPLKATTSRKA
jgi:hypothetical protein